MNIAIDFGNSVAKAAVFEGDKLMDYYHALSPVELIKLVNDHPQASVITATVTADATHIINLIENKSRLTKLEHKTPTPISNTYLTPETLGMDRLAAVVGANYLYPKTDCLVIDAGTCITYDFVDENAVYHGGSISLGLKMRFKALHHFTSRLPLLEYKEDKYKLIGKDTEEAMVSGVVGGIENELIGIISSYIMRYPQLKVIICGGDGPFFESIIKQRIFAVPELVLIGLNRILIYNAEKA